MQQLIELSKALSDGLTDSILLGILVLVDTTLAISWRIKKKQGLTSSTLLSGLLRNTVLSMLPGLITVLSGLHEAPLDWLYPVFTTAISVFVLLGLLQSITSWTHIWGMTLPEKLLNFLNKEIEDKVDKHGIDKRES